MFDLNIDEWNEMGKGSHYILFYPVLYGSNIIIQPKIWYLGKWNGMGWHEIKLSFYCF